MHSLSLSVLDLVQNSLRHGATLVEITIDDNEQDGVLSISIKDNGCGIKDEALGKVTDPFYSNCKTHKVGLGIPLFHQRAVLTGGSFNIASKQGIGTVISGLFNKRSIDYVPLGDIGSVMQCLVSSSEGVNYILSYKSNSCEFTVDTLKLFMYDEFKDLSLFQKAAFVKEIVGSYNLQ